MERSVLEEILKFHPQKRNENFSRDFVPRKIPTGNISVFLWQHFVSVKPWQIYHRAFILQGLF